MATVMTREQAAAAVAAATAERDSIQGNLLELLRGIGQCAASFSHWVGTPGPAPPPALYQG